MKQSFKAKRRTTHNATRTPSERDNTALPILHAAKALLYVLGISLLLLSATSLIAYFSPDPDTLVMPLGLGVTALSSFLGGYLTLRISAAEVISLPTKSRAMQLRRTGAEPLCVRTAESTRC